jgi:hypothetical protein
MKPCTHCHSTRFLSISAKCNDLCFAEIDGQTHDGYVPFGLNLGGDENFIEFKVCADCGFMRGKWPLLHQPLSGRRIFTAQRIDDGHRNRIREEITSYLDEYFRDSGYARPENIEAYIRTQTSIVLARLYSNYEENVDPETVTGDYYREAIAEYGTVYDEYPLC